MLVCSRRVSPSNSVPALLLQIAQLVDRRLAIAGLGLEELRQHLAAGRAEEAERILEKLDEDLHLLCRRLRREVETVAPRSSVLYGCASAAN
jgi:hypothetical protein